MSIAEIMARLEAAWLRIMSDGRETLVLLARQKGATDDELDSLIQAHDEMQQAWYDEEMERIFLELLSLTRPTIH